MTTFLISDESEINFFYRVGKQVGGLTAVHTTKEYARKFKTKEQAQSLLDKWKGTGVGIEFFKKIVKA